MELAKQTDLDAELLKAMIKQSEEVYFVFDVLNNRFQFINHAFEMVTKLSRKDVIEKPESLVKLIHHEDLAYIKKSFKGLLTKTEPSLLDFRIRRADQIERWIRLKVYPLLNDDKITHLAGSAEDDSARKLGIFNMQKINGWKDANLEILAHDLRGPIGTVQMLASVIDKKLPDNPELHKLTQMIETISKRNIHLIESLLTREFLATAEVEISRERLDVVWEIKQAMDIYLKSQQNIKKHISFTHSHESIFANIDSMKFLQVINNLVSNAIKFTGDDGEIRVHLEKLETTFLVSVADNGIGIPKSLQPSLFKKYSKAGRVGTEGEKSIGLGMWIVERLTEEHGGKVWFDSVEGKGSTFYVELPLGW
ncbi:two-component system sensor histidine kinase VicK [Pedobacter sp. CAN_A7]|uniref:PAS domain-containing sensor histidine kinase n=1 Tax=Pedobacter sp. CAN_A7 TaxID=2787722 RepID=UPI0018C97CBA